MAQAIASEVRAAFRIVAPKAPGAVVRAPAALCLVGNDRTEQQAADHAGSDTRAVAAAVTTAATVSAATATAPVLDLLKLRTVVELRLWCHIF